jgi:hypothetical protein
MGSKGGRPPVDLSGVAALLWPHQPLPLGGPMISDRSHYFWRLGCRKHVRMATTQAVVRQLQRASSNRQHLVCERCHAHESHSVHRSKWEAYAWRLLEDALTSMDSQESMSHTCWKLHGPELGYVVEAKVLGGTSGAADIYVPGLELVIQVDGEHHNTEGQLCTDAKFDHKAFQQMRRVLRLHHEDELQWHNDVAAAIQCCTADPAQAWVMYSASHPQRNRPPPPAVNE